MPAIAHLHPWHQSQFVMSWLARHWQLEILVFCKVQSCQWNIMLQLYVAGLFHLQNISRIRKYISCHTAEILVHAFITSRLDFCNSLLYGLTKQTIKRLQHIQNAAARMVALTPKHEHISPVLQELHWLPVEQCVVFKILLVTFKCLNGIAPSYLSDLVTRYIPRRNLRSANGCHLFNVKYNLRNFGFRSFSVASLQLWNDMSLEIRSC